MGLGIGDVVRDEFSTVAASDSIKRRSKPPSNFAYGVAGGTTCLPIEFAASFTGLS